MQFISRCFLRVTRKDRRFPLRVTGIRKHWLGSRPYRARPHRLASPTLCKWDTIVATHYFLIYKMLFTEKHFRKKVNVMKCQRYAFHVYSTCVQKSNLNSKTGSSAERIRVLPGLLRVWQPAGQRRRAFYLIKETVRKKYKRAAYPIPLENINHLANVPRKGSVVRNRNTLFFSQHRPLPVPLVFGQYLSK